MGPDSDAATVRRFAERFAATDATGVTDAAQLLSETGRERLVESFPEEFRQGPLDAEAALESYWWGLYSQYGAFERVEVAGYGEEVTVTFHLTHGSEAATVAVDADGVADVSFAPSYEVPDYVDPDAFTDREATVDAGDVDLEGVLAVPDGDGPFPGVVLVHGAGIHDPDGTAGNSKILEDVAEGLASHGIATLRYAKRLRDHDVADEAFTFDRVVTDDAVAAVDELAAVDAVDAASVFVVGHSQGGMAAPRIADHHGGVAGVVVLDAPADPTVDPDDLAFMRYGMDPDGDLTDDQEAELETQRATFRRIAAGEYDDDETLMGKPGVWHRTATACDPAGTAAELEVPTFVAKAGRADAERQPELLAFLHEGVEAWRDADLPDGSRVEWYQHVDHYFQAGPTPTTMDGLYFGGNVDPDVIADLATWIRDTADV
jgi:hypothetical protein